MSETPVFPAYAGMSRPPSRWLATSLSFPRLRGDEPGDCRDIMREMPVFPAYAGMSPR